ncbi:hypothetical protein [uncultured Mucilaginibacter sp.]|uniref:hypothetical protein n=1 Tax=uncultured Mucilaginibacter sp. TaxID=797541 RepID=UPI0025EDC84C|nr:hypothetical protein [uncultured Mucilaginibacter sp.]
MKYAYIIGSNAFVVHSKVITYANQGEDKEFLRINAIYHDQGEPAPETHLDCDINIKDLNGTPVTLLASKAVNDGPYTIKTARDSVEVLRTDGSTLIHIHQMDDDTAMSLEHNITAELEVSMPVVVIRIFGDFILGDLRISAQSEKLFVNDNGYGNSVQAGLNQLRFTEEGVEV